MSTATLTAVEGHTAGNNDPARGTSCRGSYPSLNTPAAASFPRYQRAIKAGGFLIAASLVLVSAVAVLSFVLVWRPVMLLARYLRP